MRGKQRVNHAAMASLPRAGACAVVIRGRGNADELAVKFVRGDQRGTGTGEVMEDDVVRFRECCDQLWIILILPPR
jgi:hypothetical protein